MPIWGWVIIAVVVILIIAMIAITIRSSISEK